MLRRLEHDWCFFAVDSNLVFAFPFIWDSTNVKQLLNVIKNTRFVEGLDEEESVVWFRRLGIYLIRLSLNSLIS